MRMLRAAGPISGQENVSQFRARFLPLPTAILLGLPAARAKIVVAIRLDVPAGFRLAHDDRAPAFAADVSHLPSSRYGR